MNNVALVICAEGLGNPRVVDALKCFGRQKIGSFKPVLATITPASPIYFVDPLKDPKRTTLPKSQPGYQDIHGFADSLSTLSNWFDIGLHGHFYGHSDGRMVPEPDGVGIMPQFNAEVELMTDLGFRPKVYAGGWGRMSSEIATLLELSHFEIDTTVNSEKVDDFGRLQYGRHLEFGHPGYLTRSVMEIPTSRRIFHFNFGPHFFFCYSFHDYELLSQNRETRAKVAKMSELSNSRIFDLCAKAVVTV